MPFTEHLLKITLAVLAGGLIGAEREFRDKAAGFRTLIFICVGAALFTIFSMEIGVSRDTARIAAQIVSGVGFLGAGVIMRESGNVIGLTTASTIWLTAAIGMGIGSGYYAVALTACAFTLVVLWLFPYVEGWIDKMSMTRSYTLVCPLDLDRAAALQAIFRDAGLDVHTVRQCKRDQEIVVTVDVDGAPAAHQQVIERLLREGDVRELSF